MSFAGAGAARARDPSDFDIQEWVYRRFGFVPHPFWIAHCKELYLGVPRNPEVRPAWHECPVDKRAQIREAFLHFGLFSEPAPEMGLPREIPRMRRVIRSARGRTGHGA